MNAVQGMYASFKKMKNKGIIAATGALTNIALLIHTFPEILEKIENTNYHPFKQGILFMYREVLLDMEPSKKISREINLFYFLGILILILILVLVIVLVMVSMNNMKKKI